MKKLVNLLLVLLFGFLFLSSFAQDTLVIKDQRHDLFASLSENEKLETLISLTDSLITRDWDLSLCYAQEALNLSKQLNNQESELAVTIQLANIYFGRTELIKAMAFIEQAKALALKLDKNWEYIFSLLITGNIYKALGDYEKSVEVYFEALKMSEKIMDKDLIGKALCSIGIVYSIQKNNTKALEYYNQSLEISRQNNDLIGISRDLNKVATMYVIQEKYQKAIILLKEAASINKKNGRKLWEGINYYNLGFINQNIKNYDTAYFYYQKTVSIYSELNSIPNLVTVYIRLAEYFNEINKPTERLCYSRKAFEIWKEFDIRFKQVHIEFYDKLIARFSDLTPTEQRLGAFLKLNMTTKEISELTGQRTSTIEVSRTRLRKKLGLTYNNTNLVTFLTHI